MQLARGRGASAVRCWPEASERSQEVDVRSAETVVRHFRQWRAEGGRAERTMAAAQSHGAAANDESCACAQQRPCAQSSASTNDLLRISHQRPAFGQEGLQSTSANLPEGYKKTFTETRLRRRPLRSCALESGSRWICIAISILLVALCPVQCEQTEAVSKLDILQHHSALHGGLQKAVANMRSKYALFSSSSARCFISAT